MLCYTVSTFSKNDTTIFNVLPLNDHVNIHKNLASIAILTDAYRMQIFQENKTVQENDDNVDEENYIGGKQYC